MSYRVDRYAWCVKQGETFFSSSVCFVCGDDRSVPSKFVSACGAAQIVVAPHKTTEAEHSRDELVDLAEESRRLHEEHVEPVEPRRLQVAQRLRSLVAKLQIPRDKKSSRKSSFSCEQGPLKVS